MNNHQLVGHATEEMRKARSQRMQTFIENTTTKMNNGICTSTTILTLPAFRGAIHSMVRDFYGIWGVLEGIKKPEVADLQQFPVCAGNRT